MREHDEIPGEFTVDLVEPALTRLRVRPATDAAGSADAATVAADASVSQARSFIAQLGDRWETLRRVAECAIERQKEFLVGGAAALKPLTRAEVAAELDLHESTVSRTVADKYALLPDRHDRAAVALLRRQRRGRRGAAEAARVGRRPMSPTSASPSCCARPAIRSPGGPWPSTGRVSATPRLRAALTAARPAAQCGRCRRRAVSWMARLLAVTRAHCERSHLPHVPGHRAGVRAARCDQRDGARGVPRSPRRGRRRAVRRPALRLTAHGP